VSDRPRHTKKELEALLKEAEGKDWRVSQGKKYFTMKCPCQDKHLKTVHLSPSGPNYEKNLRGWLSRSTCWTREADR
jgi:hypothetical protein